ncbi:MAG: hypothetical protein KatS3mg081_0318 [Gemmatimonadales bacterium]|nr:MAG: hypothetical protein KatS3mg081_0318 [Gemmatimonadales bacterium]
MRLAPLQGLRRRRVVDRRGSGGGLSELRKRVSLAALTWAALLALGCDSDGSSRDKPFGRSRTTIGRAISPPHTQAVSRIPAVSCIRKLSWRGVQRVLARLEPSTAVEPNSARDTLWLPIRITDVAPVKSGLAVLDAGAQRVILLNDLLTPLRAWGGAGGGPGEFAQAQATASNQAGDSIWVLDVGRICARESEYRTRVSSTLTTASLGAGAHCPGASGSLPSRGQYPTEMAAATRGPARVNARARTAIRIGC